MMMGSGAQSPSLMGQHLMLGAEPQTELTNHVRSSISPVWSKNLQTVSTINQGVRARYALSLLSSPRATVPTHAIVIKLRAKVQPRARLITPYGGRSRRRCGRKKGLYPGVQRGKVSISCASSLFIAGPISYARPEAQDGKQRFYTTEEL